MLTLTCSHDYRRRGHAVATVAITLVPLLAFGALAIDLSVLFNVRAELQRTADASALAGARALSTDAKLAKNDTVIAGNGKTLAADIAAKNPVLCNALHLKPSDVEFGIIADPRDQKSPFTAAPPSKANAIRVTARRTKSSTDGPVPLFLAAIFGMDTASIIGTATAVLDDRFAGYRPPEGSGPLLPITIRRSLYESQLVTGKDEYSYSTAIAKGADGIPEVHLYPTKQKNSTELDGGGNFGILNIGTPNLSLGAVESQIIHGVLPANLEAEIGSTEMYFYNDSGQPITYTITGTTGIKVSIQDALSARLGQIVGFFLHDDVKMNGSGAAYKIVAIRFGRIMEVTLQGNGSNRALVIQPVAYNGPDILTDPEAPSAQQYVSHTYLVR